VVCGEERIPPGAPDHLEDVPTGAAKDRLELLDDLAVAAHGAVEPLEVAVHDEDQVVETLSAGERDRAEGLRLVALTVADERPHLAALGAREASRLQILHEARLVDRHQRAEAHRDRRELPEVGHQPWVRVGGQARAVEAAVFVDLLAEPEQALLAEPPLEKRACVDAGGRMALEIHEVACVRLGRRAPEVVEPDLVQRRGRLVRGDVSAELRRILVRLQHDRHRVPADEVREPLLEHEVPGVRRLLRGGDRVDVGGAHAERRRDASACGVREHAVEEEPRPFGTVAADDGVERVEPVERLVRVDVGRRFRSDVAISYPRPPALDRRIERAGQASPRATHSAVRRKDRSHCSREPVAATGAGARDD
jgi:hypothetical protein